MRHNEKWLAGIGLGALGLASTLAVTKPATGGTAVATATPWHIKSMPLASAAALHRLPPKLLRAGRVSIALKNVPLSAALPRLSKKLGITLLIDNQTNGMQMNQGQPAQVDLSKRVTMSARNVSVWKALDEFSAKTGLYPAPWDSDQTNSLDVAYCPNSVHPLSVAGPFFAEAIKVQARLRQYFSQKPPYSAVRRHVRVGVWMIAEPKINIVNIEPPVVTKATDANGKSLVLKEPGKLSSNTVSGCSWEAKVPVRYPSNGGKIAVLEGYCPVDVEMASVPWTLKNLATARPEGRIINGVRINFLYFGPRADPQSYKLLLTLSYAHPKGKETAKIAARRLARLGTIATAIRHSISLQTASGADYDVCLCTLTTFHNDVALVTVHFDPPTVKDATGNHPVLPAEMRLRVPTKLARMRAPFAFRDLAVPRT